MKRVSSLQVKLVTRLLFAFFAGIFLGRYIYGGGEDGDCLRFPSSAGEYLRATASTGSSEHSAVVVNIDEVRVTSANHVLDDGSVIKKQVLLEKGKVPTITHASVVTFEDGQKVNGHSHASMSEMFYVTEGAGVFEISGEQYDVREGTFVMLPPKTVHSIWRRTDDNGGMHEGSNGDNAAAATALQMLVTGVAIDTRR
jgi:quercetin dioxygenase-like cupin family protein